MPVECMRTTVLRRLRERARRGRRAEIRARGEAVGADTERRERRWLSALTVPCALEGGGLRERPWVAHLPACL